MIDRRDFTGRRHRGWPAYRPLGSPAGARR